MQISSFIPISFNKYDERSCSKKIVNCLGQKLDALFYVGTNRAAVLEKNKAGQYIGQVEGNSHSCLRQWLTSALKVAFWFAGFAVLGAFAFNPTSAVLLGVGVGLVSLTAVLFASKCLFRLFNQVFYNQLSEDDETAIVEGLDPPEQMKTLETDLNEAIEELYKKNDDPLNNAISARKIGQRIKQLDTKKEFGEKVYNLYLKHAAKKIPDPYCQYLLAECFFEGYGCSKDLYQAQKLAAAALSKLVSKRDKSAAKKLLEKIDLAITAANPPVADEDLILATQ